MIAVLRTTLLAFAFSAIPFVLQAAPPAPPPLEAYGDLPGIEDMSISPSGTGLAIAARINGERSIVALDGERKARAVLPLDDTKLRYISWAGEDLLYVVTSATVNLGINFTADKTELSGAILVPLNGGKMEAVFAGRSSIANAVWGNYGTRQVDDKWYGYFGGLEYARSAGSNSYVFDHGRPALFEVDLVRNKPKKTANAPSQNHLHRWLIDGNGEVAVTLDISTTNGRWDITNSRGQVIAEGVDPNGDLGLISLGRDGNSVIYYLEDESVGYSRWFEVPLAGGAPSEILSDKTIDRIYVDRTNGRMLGYIEDKPSSLPVMHDPAQQQTMHKVYPLLFTELLHDGVIRHNAGLWYCWAALLRCACFIAVSREVCGVSGRGGSICGTAAPAMLARV